MKRNRLFAAALTLTFLLSGCGATKAEPEQSPSPDTAAPEKEVQVADAVELRLSDSGITVDGAAVGTDPAAGVYMANDIVYYEAGRDFTYGEGTEADAHSAEAAAAHTVLHITRPGTYSLSGSLKKGQVAVDLGDSAEDDPEAVVTLILNGVDISCEVAPAIIFYNVYECGSADAESASKDVDTSAAGANVIIADGTENTVSGAYVARIYEPDSLVLSEDGSEVSDAKKLHKYDAAFYSKMSMNVGGGSENSGILTINAENEGLDSELHLTINGGIIRIHSGNDGINTNEDGVSVTTINGGELDIRVNGATGEGDGIDSNGWLVINGGTVSAQACAFSGDAGIDSDMGIYINGGTVIASGHMLDRIEDGGQNYAVFSFAEAQAGGLPVSLKDEKGNSRFESCPENAYSVLVYSSPELTAGDYTLWSGDVQMAGMGGGIMGGPGMQGKPGMMPGGAVRPEMPEGMNPPEGRDPFAGLTPPEDRDPLAGLTPPEDGDAFEGFIPPEDMEMPEDGGRPGGQMRPGGGNDGAEQALTTEFQITDGGNMFQNISPAE